MTEERVKEVLTLALYYVPTFYVFPLWMATLSLTINIITSIQQEIKYQKTI